MNLRSILWRSESCFGVTDGLLYVQCKGKTKARNKASKANMPVFSSKAAETDNAGLLQN